MPNKISSLAAAADPSSFLFLGSNSENVNYSFFTPTGAKDCFDLDHVGMGTSESYELHSSFGSNRVFFSSRIYNSHSVSYSDDVYHSENIFGCAGLRKKSYCILNKQYEKDEYEILIEKLKKQMNDMPYKDKQDRFFKYGEFFPIEIIPFSYNDSVVYEYFPLTKEEIFKNGYKYKELESRSYKPTILPDQLPEIKDVDQKIFEEVIQCEHRGNCNHKCTTAFRIIQNELNICKTLEVPLPKLCPNCRHIERLRLKNPLKLWERTCMCKQKNHFHGKENCKIEFKTSYAPERLENIYCDKCYKEEVY